MIAFFERIDARDRGVGALTPGRALAPSCGERRNLIPDAAGSSLKGGKILQALVDIAAVFIWAALILIGASAYLVAFFFLFSAIS